MNEQTWRHNAALLTLRVHAAEALRGMLRARETWPEEEGTPPFVGCEVLSCHDVETPPTPAERQCFRLALAFLASQPLAGLERKTLPRAAPGGEPEPVRGEVARLTAEGASNARAMLSAWEFDARAHKRQLIAAAVSLCERQAMDLEPPETAAEEAALAGCRRVMSNARAMVEVMERIEAAGQVSGGSESPELAELVTVTDAGPVYEGDLWHTVKAETARDIEAIRAALEASPPPALEEYARTCLSLGAELRGVNLTFNASEPDA